MFPNINPSSALFLDNLQQIQTRMSKDEEQLTSGLKISVASDSPDQISSVLQVRAQIAGVQQTQQNLSSITPAVNAAETAIQQAIQALDTATTLATAAAGTSMTASQRANSVPQVQSVLEQLVSLSQTNVGGTYIFGGSQDSGPSYSLNLANSNGVNQLSSSSSSSSSGQPVQVKDANGVPFSIGLTAQEIFDDGDVGGTTTYPSDNVFAAVTGLLNSLQNNDSTGIQTALTNIQAAAAHLNDESSFYGGVQNTISGAGTTADSMLVTLQQQLSSLQDADAVQATLDLTAVQTNEQAAMSAEAQLKPQSLFNYLG